MVSQEKAYEILSFHGACKWKLLRGKLLSTFLSMMNQAGKRDPFKFIREETFE
jgi:hypothetical protein